MCYGKKIQAAATKWELGNTPASSWMDGYSAIILPSENRSVIDPPDASFCKLTTKLVITGKTISSD